MLITDSCYNQNKKRKDLKNTTTAHIQALFLHATSNHSFVEQPLKCVVVIKIIGKGRKTGGGGNALVFWIIIRSEYSSSLKNEL